MRPIRQFKLVNSEGNVFDLSGMSAFFSEPSGMGFDRQYTTIAAGSDFLLTEEKSVQKAISGEIAFDSYTKYTEFAGFVAGGILTLQYAPDGKMWYSIKCRVSSLAKSEMSGNVLITPVSFVCMGQWYSSAEVKRPEISTENSKKYTYAYPYTYADTASGSVIITNRGSLDSPCRLHIYGPVDNPSWSLLSGGKVLCTGKVYATIPDGNKLVIDAAPGTMEIAERRSDNTLVTNRYQDSDWSTGRFIYVPHGEYILAFTHEGTGKINALVEVSQLAETV